jgi:hypothetical protein
LISKQTAAQGYLWAAWLVAILLPIQFYFAAAGAFSTLGYTAHQYLGLGIHAVSGLLIVIALVGRLPRPTLAWGLLQFILISIQLGLARLQFPKSFIALEPQFVRDLSSGIMQPIHDAMGNGAGIIASLHGLNALAIVAVAVLTIRYAKRLSKETVWAGVTPSGSSREAVASGKK